MSSNRIPANSHIARGTQNEPSPYGLLRKTERQPKLQRLLRQQRQLMREIERKRHALEAVQSLSADIGSELAAGFESLRERLTEAASEVRKRFAQLVSPKSGLHRRHRNQLQEIYVLLSAEYDLPPLYEIATPRPSPQQPRAGSSSRAGSSERASREERQAQSTTATPPHSAQALRATFRRLASELHPDKVQDELERARRTDLMKCVTHAYQAGDLARLFELEQKHAGAALPVAEDVDARVEQLTQTNRQLRSQLRRAAEDLKQAKAALPFAVDLSAKDGGREAARERIAALVEEATEEVATLVEIAERLREYFDGGTDIHTLLARLPQVGMR